MANEEHVKLLLEGVEAWNAWREEHPEIRPELEYEDLSGKVLSGVRLDGALLDGVGFEFARLDGARLDGASLVIASLHNTDLDGTNFGGAHLGFTAIGDTDLSQSQGLETVNHIGPSSIATSTLERTAAGLAKDSSRRAEIEAFLRDAGVSESYLQIFQRSVEQPPEFYSCFISYSHEDKRFARRIYEDLKAGGIRCYLDEVELRIGDKILPGVMGAIRLHDKVVLCCSRASLTSVWVKREVELALQREMEEDRLLLLPLNLDGYLFEGYEGPFRDELRSRLSPDFTGWESDNARFEAEFRRVVAALQTGETARETPTTPKL